MTRINAGIDPQELPDKLLLAEHREITRIPNAVKNGIAKIENIPEEFTLGKGHVKFFYTRLGYLRDRYRDIYQECLRRQFNITDRSTAFDDQDQAVLGDYSPTDRDRAIVIARIESHNFRLITLRPHAQRTSPNNNHNYHPKLDTRKHNKP